MADLSRPPRRGRAPGRRPDEGCCMPQESSERRSVRELSKTRVEAFSDGVIAIAITLLVLDLAVHATGDAAPPVPRGVAVVPRLRGELPHNRRCVDRPQRAHRPTRPHRHHLPAIEPAVPPARRLPPVPDETRLSEPARERVAGAGRNRGVRHDPARDPAHVLRPRPLLPTRARRIAAIGCTRPPSGPRP